MPAPFSGGCACGAIRYQCTAEPFVSYACHCTACQKRTGSAFGISVQVAAEALRVVRGSPATRVRIADSGNALTTHFCPACGTTVFGENRARPRICTITGGSLDDPRRFPIQAHIWTRSALPWVSLGDEVERFEKGGDWTAYYAADPTRLEP